jgi:hypothetical protein
MMINEKELARAMEDNPVQTVAMVAVQAIGELSGVMDKAGAHDEASEALVIGLCAWLTSVLDGKDAAPGQALVDTAKTMARSLVEEVSRCQHFVAELNDRTRKAESEALVSKQYASWYLRLRDGNAGDAVVITGDLRDPIHCEREDLDALMEDLDEPDPGNDIDKPE